MLQSHNSKIRTKSSRLALLIALTLLVVCLGACSPEHTSYSDFRDVPDEGWLSSTPIYLTPQVGDSTGSYDVTLVVRHNTSYPFKDLRLVVDFLGSGGELSRRRVSFSFADERGKLKSAGFGGLYQASAVVARAMRHGQLRRVVVWPGISDCDTLQGIVNVGIIVSPAP